MFISKLSVKSINKANSNKSLYLLAFLIPLFIVLFCMGINHFAPWGDRDVISASGDSSYYQYYYELYDHFHYPELFQYSPNATTPGVNELTASTSLSDNHYASIAYYLSDPSNFIILLGSRNSIPAILNILYAIKLALCSLFMCVYLSTRKNRIILEKEAHEAERNEIITSYENKLESKSNKNGHKPDFIIGKHFENNKLGKCILSFDFLSLLLSISYSLGQYFVASGMNPTRTLAIALFPLLVLGLDRILLKKTWSFFTIVYALIFICNFHIAIISTVFVFIYLCISSYSDTKHLLYTLISIVKSIITVLLIITPLLCLISQCSEFRNDFSMSFPTIRISSNFGEVLRQLLAHSTPERVQLLYYSIDIYFGIFFIFCFFMFICNSNIPAVRRVKYSITALLLLSGTSISSIKYFLNGFYYSNTSRLYYGYIISFFAVCIAQEVLVNIRHVHKSHIYFCTAITLLVTITPLIFAQKYDSISPFIISVEFLMTYFLITMIYRSKSMTHNLYLLVITVICSLELFSSFAHSIKLLGGNYVTRSHEYNHEYMLYETKLHILTTNPGAKILYYDGNDSKIEPFCASVFGYDFVIVENNSNALSKLTKTDNFNGFDIYQNPYSLKAAFFKLGVNHFNYDYNAPFASINTLSEDYMAGNNIYDINSGGSITYSIDNDSNSSNITYTADKALDFYGAYNHFAHLGTGNIGKSVTTNQKLTKLPPSTYSVAAFTENGIIDLFNQQVNYLNNLSIKENSLLFIAPEDGYLLLNSNDYRCDAIELKSVDNILPYCDNAQLYFVRKGVNLFPIEKKHFPYWTIIFSLFGLILLLINMKNTHKRITINTDKITTFVTENRIYFICFFINLTLITMSLIMTSSAPFGNRTILTNDGVAQTLPYSYYLWNSIQNGSAAKTIDTSQTLLTGSTYDFITRFINPTFWILLFISKKYIVLAINCLYSIIFSFSSFSIIFYLTHKHGVKTNKKDYRLIPISLAYSLSAYSITFITYLGFSFPLFLPLIIYALERAIYEKKYYSYIFLLALFMKNAYYAFILCEFLILYFCTMDFRNTKDFIRKSLRFMISSICSAGLACIFLIPFYAMTQASNYSSRDTSEIPSIFSFTTSYSNIFNLLKIGTTPQDVTPDSWRAAIYCGLIVFITFPLYILNKNISIKRRIKNTLLLVLLFVAFNNSFLNFVFHGFHHQSQVPNRFAIFYIFILIICFYENILTQKQLHKTRYLINVIILSSFLATLWIIKSTTLTLSLEVSLLFLLIYLITALVSLFKKKYTTKAFQKTLLSILIIELIFNTLGTLNFKVGTDLSSRSSEINAIELLEFRNPNIDNDFVNTEVINSNIINLSQYTNINTITSFNNALPVQSYQSVDKWCVLRSVNFVDYQIGNPLADMMLRVQYNIVDDKNDESYSTYPEIDKVQNYSLHKNPHVLPLAYVLQNNKALKQWDKLTSYYYKNAFKYENEFTNSQGAGNIYDEFAYTIYDKGKTVKNTQDTYIIKGKEYTYTESNNDINKYCTLEVHLSDNITGQIYIASSNTIIYLGDATSRNHNFEIPMTLSNMYDDDGELNLHLATLNKENIEKLYNNLSKTKSYNDTLDSSSISTNMILEKDSTVYISLPSLEGLSCYDNGKLIQSESLAGGIAINLPKGTHHIEVRYKIPGLTTGCIVSITTLMILLIYWLIFRKRFRNTDPLKDNTI